jgi:hypothetical protein
VFDVLKSLMEGMQIMAHAPHPKPATALYDHKLYMIGQQQQMRFFKLGRKDLTAGIYTFIIFLPP